MKTRHYVDDPVFVRSDFRCTYCGCDLLADFDRFMGMARDHLVPKSAGGPDAGSGGGSPGGLPARPRRTVCPG